RPRATITDLIWAAGGPARDAGRVVEFVPAESAAPSRATQSTTVGDGRCDATPADLPSMQGAPTSAWLAVRAVSVEPTRVGRTTTITLSRAPDRFESFVLADPPRLVVDIDGPLDPTARPTADFALADPLVERVRAAAFGSRLRV